MTPRAKYRKMAYGRDEGLVDIAGDPEKAFDDWYCDKSHRGGHPWEICRGGNSTHISLIVHKKKEGWQLYLAGSRITKFEYLSRTGLLKSYQRAA